jgi:hypothetical protein
MNWINTEELIARRDELIDEREELIAEESNEINAEIAEIDEIESYCEDFYHGETLIPEEDWVDYARDLAESVGAVSGDEGWPLNCIDWDYAAEQLATDYSLVEYRGSEYYVR